MKLGPVSKLDKRNTATSKEVDDDVMSAYCGISVIFPVHGQFGATWKPDSRSMVCNTYFSLIVTFYLTKSETELKNL